MTGKNATRDPELVLAEWLDEGPVDLPDTTRRAILTALPTTPQARRGPFGARWFNVTRQLARAAVVALVAVVAIGGAYLFGSRTTPATGGPTASATPTPTAIDTTTWQHITSRLFGITYDVPPGLVVEASNWPWLYGGDSPTDTGTDFVRRTDQAVLLSVRSQRVPTDVDAAAWWATYFLTYPYSPSSCEPRAQTDFTATTVDGVAAYEWDQLERCAVVVVVVFDDGRAYELTYRNPPPPGDRAVVAAWLASVRLAPGKAVDPSPGSPTGPPAS
jgi:hypothetical protein